MLTAERVRELLSYEPMTGFFLRKLDCGGRKAGERAGYPRKDGRWVVSVDDQKYLSSRLAWLFVTGAWPTWEIDHIDCNPGNDVFSNLRDVSRGVNQQNVRQALANNLKSGLLGVGKTGNKWAAKIRAGGKQIYLGLFATPQEAHSAYVNAKRRLHAGNTL